jgi:hypothetical protein
MTTADPANPSAGLPDPDTLITELEAQVSVVEKLASMSMSQRAFIEDHRIDDLLHHLGRRQTLVDQLLRDQARLMQSSERLMQHPAGASDAQRQTIRACLQRISNGLADVAKADAADDAAIRDLMQSHQQELQTVGAGKNARNAYLKAKAVNNRFADQRG